MGLAGGGGGAFRVRYCIFVSAPVSHGVASITHYLLFVLFYHTLFVLFYHTLFVLFYHTLFVLSHTICSITHSLFYHTLFVLSHTLCSITHYLHRADVHVGCMCTDI